MRQRALLRILLVLIGAAITLAVVPHREPGQQPIRIGEPLMVTVPTTTVRIF